MYINNKNDTNIDNQFKKENILSILFKKYKIIIIITIIIFLLILMISIFMNRKITNYIYLDGNDELTLYQGNDYIEPGYNAYNSKDENLNQEVIINSNLDINKPGNYEITYTLDDITVTRKIKIIEKPTDYEYIYLKTVNNNINIYLKIGETYKEPGYTVFSSTGKNLTNKVTITGTVDTSKKGDYKLIYSLVDSNGVTVSASRTVIVMDSEINLSLNNKEITNQDVTININILDNYFDYIVLPDGNKVYKANTSYKVSKNGTYKFTVYNTKGSKKESSIIVNNIDKTPPTGNCSGNYKNGKSTITINANDNSGIKKYIVNGKEYFNNEITLDNEISIANIIIYDNANNTKQINCNLESQKSTLEMHFIASGAYDDAILIRTNDKTILIDSGQWYCRKYVTPYLKTLGITKIDAMIGSHLHFNHIQAQADILENFEVKNIYYPDDIFKCANVGSCDSTDQAYIVNALKNKNITPQIIKPGNKIKIGEIELYFIGPEKITTGKYAQNANSFIIILKFYNNTFMFTGDAGSSTLDINKLQPHANKLGISLDIDLLKYPHHGNMTFTNHFLNTINAEYVIVPNYKAPNLPSNSNINILKSYNTTIYRQSDSKTGNILVTSDGSNIKIINDVIAENYKK